MMFVVAGALIASGVLYWLVKGVLSNWEELTAQLLQTSPVALISAVALLAFFFVCFSFSYHNSLQMSGANIRASASVCIYLASLLGKYIPGRLFVVAGQVALNLRQSVTVKQSIVGITAYHIFELGVGVLIASPLLAITFQPWILFSVVGIGITGLGLLASGVWIRPLNAWQRRRKKPEFGSFSVWIPTRAVLWTFTGWMSYSGSAAGLTIALMPHWDLFALWHVAMAAVAAWIIGFLSFIIPSGIGIREGSFILLTRTVIPEPIALASALIMRFLWTCFEALVGTAALLFLLWSKSFSRSHAE